MRDDFLSSDWAETHAGFSTSIHKLFGRIGYGFERLTARQFDAPWRRPSLGRPAR